MIIPTWSKFQELCSLKGKFVLTLWTLFMLGASGFVIYTKSDIPGGVIAVYGMVLGAFAMAKTTIKIKDKQIEMEKAKGGKQNG